MADRSRSDALRAGLAAGVADLGTLALIDEAARIAYRLDALDDIIAGKGVLQLMHFRLQNDDVQQVTMTVDNVLSEARQQQNVLRQILVTLGVGKAEATVSEPARTALDELDARRAARVAGSSGRAGA